MTFGNATSILATPIEKSVSLSFRAQGETVPPRSEELNLTCPWNGQSERTGRCIVSLAVGAPNHEADASSGELGFYRISLENGLSVAELNQLKAGIRAIGPPPAGSTSGALSSSSPRFRAEYRSLEGTGNSLIYAEWTTSGENSTTEQLRQAWKQWRNEAIRHPVRTVNLDCTGESAPDGETHFLCSLKNRGEEAVRLERFTAASVRVRNAGDWSIIPMSSISLSFPDEGRDMRASFIPPSLRSGLDVKVRPQAPLRRNSYYIISIDLGKSAAGILENHAIPAVLFSNRILLR